jgi:C-terminal processing protease CtpA/Prc
MLDSLRTAVLEIYPRELLDSSAFERALAVAREQTRAEKDSAASYFRFILNGLLRDFCPTTSGIEQYERTCHEPDVEIRFEVMPPQVRAWREDKGLGVIRVEISLPGNMAPPIDAALDSVQSARGLLLDLSGGRSCFAGDDVLAILGRFRDEPNELLTARVRIPGTNRMRDSVITVAPRGEWQYTKPVVVLVDTGWTWTSSLLAYSLSRRPYTKVIGFPLRTPRGILPRQVTLPGGTVVSIPTGVWMDRDGNMQKIIRPNVTAVAMSSENADALHEQGLRLLKDLVMANEKEELRRIEWLFDK